MIIALLRRGAEVAAMPVGRAPHQTPDRTIVLFDPRWRQWIDTSGHLCPKVQSALPRSTHTYCVAPAVGVSTGDVRILSRSPASTTVGPASALLSKKAARPPQ